MMYHNEHAFGVFTCVKNTHIYYAHIICIWHIKDALIDKYNVVNALTVIINSIYVLYILSWYLVLEA